MSDSRNPQKRAMDEKLASAWSLPSTPRSSASKTFDTTLTLQRIEELREEQQAVVQRVFRSLAES